MVATDAEDEYCGIGQNAQKFAQSYKSDSNMDAPVQRKFRV